MAAPVLLITACFFWAISFIATKHALTVIPPLTVVTFRLIISSVCFLLWFAWKRPNWAVRGTRAWIDLFVLSLFGTTLHYTSQTIGIGFTTASNASLYAVTGPIAIAVIAAVFMGERISARKGIGISLALLGVLTVLGWDTLRSATFHATVLGDLLVFSSIFMWAVFTVMSKGKTGTIPAIQLSAIITVMGTLCMLPVCYFEVRATQFTFAQTTPGAWAAVVFLGVTCSFLATLFYVMALERTQSQKVGVYLYTIPPMTYLFAALSLGETIGANLIVGSILVFAGVYVTERA